MFKKLNPYHANLVPNSNFHLGKVLNKDTLQSVFYSCHSVSIVIQDEEQDSLNLKLEFPNCADPCSDIGHLQLEHVTWPLPFHCLQTVIIYRLQSLSLPLSLQNACGNSITFITQSIDKLELTYILLPDLRDQSPGTADGEAGR